MAKRRLKCELDEHDCKSALAPNCSWCPSQNKCYTKDKLPCASCGISSSGDCPTTAGCGWCSYGNKCMKFIDAQKCKADGLKREANIKSCQLARATYVCCSSDCDHWYAKPKCGNC